MRRSLSLIAVLCLFSGCGGLTDRINPEKITSINIIDRNGLSETISSKGRLGAFEQTDFLSPQPYQKVMRVYAREKNGDVRSCITSYHPNGQIKQYLDAVNNRALGSYREWFSNGQLKIEARVIGGMADINTLAEESFLFDGKTEAYDEDGCKVAQISYNKGELEGESLYFHPNKKIWKRCPYEKNCLHGVQQIFLDDGTLFQETEYVKGMKEGPSIRYWSEGQIAYEENYENNLLMEALYYDREGKLVAKIHQGQGLRALFGKKELIELQEYHNGFQEGGVKVFDESGHLVRVYSVKNGVKQGEEIDYFPMTLKPKLLLSWHEGALQGTIKTWYENGQLESQKEVSENQKNGYLTAWYENGALMLIEEYEKDKLLKGEYYRIGEKMAVSKIEKGKGIATLFNSEGTFTRKVYYQDGKPVE